MSWYKNSIHWPRLSLPWCVGMAAAGWLVFISGFHWWLNLDHGKRRVVNMGYMPVITNLASPLLDYATRDGNGIRFRALKFTSFAEMAEALRNNQIQAAFMIAPLSIVLRQQGEDVKIIYIGNRHESTLVARKDLNVKQLSDLAGKTLAVPMRYSGHNLSILQLMEETGLFGQINVVEMNPPDMASALAAGSLDAYYVGEPFAAQTLKSGDANLVYYVEEVWKYFICNLVMVKQAFIESNPGIANMLVQGAARSGIWAENNPGEAARIASRYWNQPVELVEYALTTPKNRIVYDRFVPKQEEMQHMADLMVRFGLIEDKNISGLIEDRFARAADLSGVTDFASIFRPPTKITALRDNLKPGNLP
ncbi:MAG: ABC transporter substrate-binding protein [Planctomycetota bacterium]